MSVEVRTRLVCPSNVWGETIDAHGALIKRCRGKFCKTSDGLAVYHVFDLANGSQRTFVDEDAAENAAREVTGHARNASL